MLSGWELLHLDPDFGQNALRSFFADAHNLIDELSRFLPAHLLRGGKPASCFPRGCRRRSRVGLFYLFSWRIIRRSETTGNFLAHSPNRCIQRVNLFEMLPQHEAMMGRDVSPQRPFQLLLTGSNPSHSK